MDFTLTSEQELLRETARALLSKECSPAVLRAHIDDSSATDPLDDKLAEFAGLGTGPCGDLFVFAEELGYVAAPGRFFPTVALAAPVLAAARDERLESVLAGDATASVAVAGEDGIWAPNPDPVKTFVPEADRVDWIVVVDAGPTVRVVAPADTELRLVETIDFSRRMFEVRAPGSGAPVDPDEIRDSLTRCTVGLAAEMVGTARRLFDMSLAYAKERIQFDVPIGSFQAIQHKLAECSLAVERAVAAAQYASMTIDALDDERHRAMHVAKAAAGNAVTRAAKDGAQVHGGIGYTWEHDLHLFLRHAYGSEHWMGTTAWHHDRLADLLLGAA